MTLNPFCDETLHKNIYIIIYTYNKVDMQNGKRKKKKVADEEIGSNNKRTSGGKIGYGL